jgi:hypothetical protein
MELDKAWLYRQENWIQVDDPAARFPEEIDNLFEMLHFNPHFAVDLDENWNFC